MIAKAAWRNLWRNPRRTLITAGAMGFGLAMMVVTYGLMDGYMGQLVRYATLLNSGHLQVHHPRWVEDRSLYDTFDPAEAMAAAGREGLGPAAPRAYAAALVSAGDRSAGGELRGVDPEREGRVTEISRHLASGSFLAADTRGEVVLGANLARTLQVAPGDEVVVLTAAADGSLGNEIYRVRGVLATLGEAVDRTGVFLPLADLDQLAALGGKVHEVAVRLDRPGELEPAAASLAAALPSLSVRSWKQLMPELADMLEIYGVSNGIMLAIIFSAAALVILNTMLMSLFERTGEIGVLRALGMGPWRVAGMVGIETLGLAVLAAGAGIAGGGALGAWLQLHGWDLSGIAGSFSMVGVVFEPFLRAELSLRAFVEPTVVMVLVTAAAAVLPMVRAMRIPPAAAMKERK